MIGLMGREIYPSHRQKGLVLTGLAGLYVLNMYLNVLLDPPWLVFFGVCLLLGFMIGYVLACTSRETKDRADREEKEYNARIASLKSNFDYRCTCDACVRARAGMAPIPPETYVVELRDGTRFTISTGEENGQMSG